MGRNQEDKWVDSWNSANLHTPYERALLPLFASNYMSLISFLGLVKAGNCSIMVNHFE